jgi:hypothetical protein
MMKLTAFPLPLKRSKLMTFLVFFLEVLLSEALTCNYINHGMPVLVAIRDYLFGEIVI